VSEGGGQGGTKHETANHLNTKLKKKKAVPPPRKITICERGGGREIPSPKKEKGIKGREWARYYRRTKRLGGGKKKFQGKEGGGKGTDLKVPLKSLKPIWKKRNVLVKKKKKTAKDCGITVEY